MMMVSWLHDDGVMMMVFMVMMMVSWLHDDDGVMVT